MPKFPWPPNTTKRKNATLAAVLAAIGAATAALNWSGLQSLLCKLLCP
jgi:hypothetical protein